MTNYAAIINSLFTKCGVEPNTTISMLIDIELTCRQNDNRLLITEPDDGDGITVHCANKILNSWFIDTIRCPYGTGIQHNWTDEEVYELALRIMLDGGCVEPYDFTQYSWHTSYQEAAELLYNYDVIVLSNGEDTITFYFSVDGWFANTIKMDSCEELIETLAIELVDGYKVVFTGCQKEVE